MKCHGNDNQNNTKHNLYKLVLHFLLCCGIPIILILMLPFIAKNYPGLSGILRIAVPFLCPLIMLVMMVGMIGIRKKSNKK